jgi:hypothetical protein
LKKTQKSNDEHEATDEALEAAGGQLAERMCAAVWHTRVWARGPRQRGPARWRGAWRGGGCTAALGPQRRTPGVHTPDSPAGATWSNGWARWRSHQSAAMTTPGASFISLAQIQKYITP